MVEKMKDSGIEWIGEIPEGWDLNKIRYTTELRNEVGIYSLDDVYLGLENIESFTGRIVETETEYEEIKYDKFFENDVLFSKLRPYLAKATIAKNNGYCTGELAVIKKYSGEKRYLFYYLLSDGFLNIVDNSTYGTKMPRASWEFIKNLVIPDIPQIEQTQIANFLDNQCGKIDSIIADIEKQIEILGEYKKSLITETVTKGLDKTVAMKDSGIEWIGEIPEGWEVKRIKYCAEICNGGEYSEIVVEEGGYPVIGSGGEFARASKYCYSGESVLLGRKGTIDKPLYINDSFWCVDTMFYTKMKDITFTKYLYYCSLNIRFDYYATSTALPSMTQRDLGSEKIMLPPYTEQTLIADYLDSQCSKIDSIIEDKKEQLTKITEHKKSLIYEYVTGKKRVKEVMNHGN